MRIEENISLKPYNTFGIAANARYFAEYNDVEELTELLQSEIVRTNPMLHIGGGSNLLFLNNFEGVILHSAIKTISIEQEDENSVLLRVGSGVVWDDFVAYCVEKNFHGVENLSLIPGEVGASAVQNIGAYGVEVKDVIETVEYLELDTLQRKTITNEACEYGYRQSIFKGSLKRKTVITNVIFRLLKSSNFKLDYAHLHVAVSKNGEINLANIRNTIIEIRESKLPYPAKLGNAGSFFMNPVITADFFKTLQLDYPTMPHYPAAGNMVKVPAGWLIEQCGLKGKEFDRVAVYHKQALVIVNLGGASGKDVANLATIVQTAVKERFGIEIHPEVNYIS